jgi:hypothetical protein
MRLDSKNFRLVLAALLLGLAPALAGSKDSTFVGTVSDSMCGAQHAMPGDAAACTRACVSKGSKYALVSGTKVYTLETGDKAALGQLDKLAGQKVKVTGTASEDTIQVKSVAAGK